MGLQGIFLCALHAGSGAHAYEPWMMTGDFDIRVNVKGGGIKGRTETTRLSIARALVKVNEEWKPALKAKGLLTRDSREVERKKYGLRKARRATQFSKR